MTNRYTQRQQQILELCNDVDELEKTAEMNGHDGLLTDLLGVAVNLAALIRIDLDDNQ